jgi:hypothetical protein
VTTNEHIEQEHPEYTARARMWRKYRDLYAGGEQFRQNAAEYLVRRHKEGMEVYQERLGRVFYENYLGSIIDWYTATLVRREPTLEFIGSNDPGKAFFAEFVNNCDLRGTSLTQFFKQQMAEALVCGKSYLAIDFPRTDGPVLTRAEEDSSGRSRAYLAAYNADEVINWSRDANGDFEWVVIRTSWLKQDSVKSLGWKKETRWVYYDREKFEIYENREGADHSGIDLVDQGRHGLAGIQKVPVFEIRVTEGLWLANKVALLQMEHFNKSNALGWALTMGLFAMPVIYSDKEWNQITGESYYIQLSPNDKFGWTEPTGNVFNIAAENLTRLKDEIYRVCYLMQQSGEGNGSHQSGLSQQWGFSVTQEILRSYGDTVKDSIRHVLNTISQARQDDLVIDATGLDEFDITDFSTEASDAQSLLNMGINSPTLRKQIHKKVALKYLCDARQEIKTRIAEEIDSAAEVTGQPGFGPQAN